MCEESLPKIKVKGPIVDREGRPLHLLFSANYRVDANEDVIEYHETYHRKITKP